MAESVVVSAAQWIGALLIQEASVLYRLEDEVRGLYEELKFMQQYLQDADAKQEEQDVRTLIGQIRKLAYDAEDVIDVYILKRQAHPGLSNSCLMRFACCLYNVPHSYDVVKQVQGIQGSLKQVTDKLNTYGVRRIAELGRSVGSSYDERCWRQKARSYPYDDNDSEYVVGLEKDIQQLVKLLIDQEKTNQVNVLSIVGMGGSGKTTLAKKLYNHPYIRECFHCTAWVFISREWSTRNVFSEILRKIGGPEETTEQHAKSSVEELVDKLRNILRRKLYLVVLDDVWRSEALEEILPALPQGSINQGSKIIITTRNREIIQYPVLQQNQHIYEPRPLSEEEAWQLVSRISLSHRTNYNVESYENVGKEMLKKCDGLPLAVVALSGILNRKGSITEWQQVNEAVRSRVMGTRIYDTVGNILALSYDDLPYDLKPCFLYLGVFPEDCQIPAGMLTRMWIAEGLVTTHEEMSLEDVARQHLEELSHRFMIQVVETNLMGAIKAVRVHDLLRDLCLKEAKEQSFLEVYTSTNDLTTRDLSAFATQPRRAALHSCISFPIEVSHLRSLTVLGRSSMLLSADINKDTVDLGAVHRFKLLRLLILWGIKTLSGTLPVQIGSLLHLRYLGIRFTNITELPTSIGCLRNLLTLDYRNVDFDRNLSITIPDVLWKLVRLRHLYLPVKHPWNVKDLKLSTMRNLQTLWGVKEGRGEWLSREVPKLSTSLKKLMIVVSTEKDLEATFNCPGFMSDSLQTFYCKLREGVALQHVKGLSDRQHLRKLTLVGKLQMEFPLLLPRNVVVLELKDSILEDVDLMSPLGQLAHLKLLRLSNSYTGTTLTCNPGSFPALEELHLKNFQNLETWRIVKGAMPCLKRLQITGCKKLEQFPRGLAFLPKLQQLEFFGVPKEFCRRAKEYGWSQTRLRLPQNLEAIIQQCDSPLDTSSIRKLYEQLKAGVFLNDKKKKFWVVKRKECYYNCFMVYVTDLSLSTEVDIDGINVWDTRMDHWECSEMAERDGAVIPVMKLKAPVIVLGLSVRFNIEDLSPGISYTIAYEITYSLISVWSSLVLPDGRVQRHKINVTDQPRNEWVQVQVLVGELERRPEDSGVAESCLYYQWRCPRETGFEIRSVVIEPLLQPSSY